jgi:hypothetical protein
MRWLIENGKRQVLVRIVSTIKFLAKHNLAFRGKMRNYIKTKMVIFLGRDEMMGEFDPISHRVRFKLWHACNFLFLCTLIWEKYDSYYILIFQACYFFH